MHECAISRVKVRRKKDTRKEGDGSVFLCAFDARMKAGFGSQRTRGKLEAGKLSVEEGCARAKETKKIRRLRSK